MCSRCRLKRTFNEKNGLAITKLGKVRMQHQRSINVVLRPLLRAWLRMPKDVTLLGKEQVYKTLTKGISAFKDKTKEVWEPCIEFEQTWSNCMHGNKEKRAWREGGLQLTRPKTANMDLSWIKGYYRRWPGGDWLGRGDGRWWAHVT